MLYDIGRIFLYILQFQDPISIVNVIYLNIDTISIVSNFS